MCMATTILLACVNLLAILGMNRLGEDVRCVWLATMSSRSLLCSTRKATSSAKEPSDLALTEELREDFHAATWGTDLGPGKMSAENCYILGALAIRPSQRYSHRESHTLGDEVRHQISHWTILAGRPLHGFALMFDACESVLLDRPVSWFSFSGRRGGCFFTELEKGQTDRLVDAWPGGDCHAVFSYPFTMVLRLPLPYIVFLLKGYWKTIVVPDLPVPWNYDAYGVSKGRKFVSGLTGAGRRRENSWPALQRFGQRPGIAQAEEAERAGSALQVDNIHDGAKLWGLAECVAALGHGVSDLEPKVWQDFVEGMRYQHAESLLLASRRHAYVAGGNPSFAFRIGHLVETMLCSMVVSNDDNLVQALKLAACLLLPEKLAQEWIRRLQDDPGKYIPSKAIISQRRAALDMGYTCLQQAWVKDQLQKGAFFYALTDSSPQGGRDYEVTVLDVVLPQDAVDLLQYVREAQQPPRSSSKVCSFLAGSVLVCVLGLVA